MKTFFISCIVLIGIIAFLMIIAARLMSPANGDDREDDGEWETDATQQTPRT